MDTRPTSGACPRGMHTVTLSRAEYDTLLRESPVLVHDLYTRYFMRWTYAGGRGTDCTVARVQAADLACIELLL